MPNPWNTAESLHQITILMQNIPDQDVVAFLRSGDAGSFVPLNDVGLWSAIGRAHVDVVQATMPRGPGEAPSAASPTSNAFCSRLRQSERAVGRATTRSAIAPRSPRALPSRKSAVRSLKRAATFDDADLMNFVDSRMKHVVAQNPGRPGGCAQ